MRPLATSDTLLTYYLICVKIFHVERMFFEQLSSLYEFATNHYLSHNPVYKEFKQFKLILKEYDIDVTKEFQLVGRKVKSENLFFSFMKEYYLDHSPFPKRSSKKKSLCAIQ